MQKLGCFFKTVFFLEFRSIELVFRSIEIAIKIFGQTLFVSIHARLILDQSKHFRSIESFSIDRIIFDRSNLIFDQSKIIQRVFLKYLILTCSNTFSKSFQTLSLSIRSIKAPIKIFCRFPPFFLQGFSLLRLVRPFYPPICIYFHVSCIKSCICGEISNL